MNEEFFNNQNQYNQEYNNTINQDDTETGKKSRKPKKQHKFIRYISKIVVAAAIFGLITGVSFQGYSSIANRKGNDTKVGSNSDNITNGDKSSDGVVAVETGTQGKTTSDVSAVVENVMPSIVAINSVITNVTSDFFGRQYNEDVKGSGSGIIIGQNDDELLIATNNHVVANAKTVEIVFADNSKASATIKGTAPGSDLAVVSVHISDLKEGTRDKIKIATLGDSTQTKLGDMAIAIGNALGYGQSITVGYISALNREVTVNDVKLHVLQTDAAINPGNSGGALLNSRGEVIGINSVKYVDDKVESIGYAIPISDAIPIINQLMNRTNLKDDEKAFLGISGKDVTDVYAQRFNMPMGIYVDSISKGSPAEKAGIKIGDIIVGINNITVETMSDLQEALSYTKAGSSGTIKVKTLQDGKYADKTLNVTFGKRPAK